MPMPGQIPSQELGLAVNRKPSPFSQGYRILVGQTVNREMNKLTRRVISKLSIHRITGWRRQCPMGCTVLWIGR